MFLLKLMRLLKFLIPKIF